MAQSAQGVQKAQGVSGRTDRRWYSLALVVLLALLPHSVHSQVAGLNTLTVFDLSATARSAGLGMDYLPVYDADLSIAFDNPSLLNTSHNNSAMLSFVPFFEGSNMTALAYAHSFGRIGTFSFGMRMFNFGRFHGYDAEENYEGDFGAGDYSLVVGWSLWIDSSFSIGVNFKPVFSKYEQYSALAQAIDICGSYISSDRRLTATVMARNIGAQIMTFDNSIESLPFELSAALSYKLKGAPFRLYLTATELQRWNLSYEDPLHPTITTDPFTGEVNTQSWFASTLDNLMRHVLVGLELNLGNSVYARVGYSYRQSAEMIGADLLNMSGFSFGVGIRTKRLEFGYARSNYHLSQAPNYLTVCYRF